MTRTFFGAFLIAMGMGVAAAAQAPNLDAMDVVLKSVPDGPVAKVNGRLVDSNAFKQIYQAELLSVMRQTQSAEVPDPARAQLGLRCVGLLIERELLHDEAIKRNITVPIENVEKAWQAQLAQTQKAIKERENVDLDEGQVLARLGFSDRKEVLASLERALITEKLRATIIRESEIKVTDEEIRAEFDTDKAEYGAPARVHLQQIFVNPAKIGGTKAEKDVQARAKAQQALDRLMSGQTFEAVARALSDAPDAQKGGDMGVQAASALPPFMANAAAGLKPGEISGVIESEFGFHVIRLVAFEAPQDANFDDNARAVRARLLAERGAMVIHDYCDTLVKNGAEVEVYLELEKNLVLSGAIPAG